MLLWILISCQQKLQSPTIDVCSYLKNRTVVMHKPVQIFDSSIAPTATVFSHCLGFWYGCKISRYNL